MLRDEDLHDIEKVDLTGIGEDFTSHIEPDWENDAQQMSGRFQVQRTNYRPNGTNNSRRSMDDNHNLTRDSEKMVGARGALVID